MSFEDYRKPKPGRSGQCRKCGARSAGRVAITLQAKQENPERTVKDTNRFSYPSIASSSGAFCEACAVEIYEQAIKVLPR